ncbi:MerR family transcriptional regulator [Actinomadura miaoliensis]|uniref:MerR family transcriptional regulator n=1 Tax=Actinomadura miaoliensis TaxID=430685 RepID=A0ABP7UVY8_9ACTN
MSARDNAGEAVYRIDDLARITGTTVRHVRSFQERGLLPPPRVRGRVGYYDDTHLARIRLIIQMKERGYTLASIAEMITAYERGHNLADLLGLEKVITGRWSDEIPERLTLAEVVAMCNPGSSPEDFAGRSREEFPELARAEELDLLRWTGTDYEVPDPRLLRVGAEMVAVGIRLGAVFDIAAELRADCDAIARRFVRLTVEHAGLDDVLRNSTRKDIPEIADLIQKLRPLGMVSVQGLLARSLHTEIQAEFNRQIEKLTHRPSGPSPASDPDPESRSR